MEKFWNNKRIQLLLAADTDTVEQFFDQFVPVIYTWMYYHVGADAKIATDLTGRAFSQVVRNLSNFDPTRQTLFQWLKQQAMKSRDEGMAQWQMKPQRPWAWSQLPDEVLCGLSRFRCEPLDDKTLSNLFLHEMVQAAMMELDSRDRELLMHRFCHLDKEENIAEEMDCRIEDIQNWLYRSRHSFRRGLFQLVASVNNGFSESSNAGDIEVQDNNLERLLSTTTLYQALDNVQVDIIRKQLLQSLEETAQSLPKETSRPLFFMARIVFVIIVLLAGAFWMMRNDNTNSSPLLVSTANTPRQASPQKPVRSEKRQATQDEIDGEELKRIFALGQAGNVDALLEILKSGQFVSQRIAAPFLGELADPSAIDPLQQAGEHWYPKSPDDNPFADAIEQILIRFPDAVPPVVFEEVESEPNAVSETEKKTQQPPATIPTITGLVSDFSNQPVSNAEVELTEKLLFAKTDTGRRIGSAQTNPLGQFQFSDIRNQCISLTCRIPVGDVRVITQPLWCGKDSISIVNLGGRPVLTGTAIIDGKPLASQTLYLSDKLDMISAAFREEVITDGQGNFSFLGVSPGVYSIMNRGLDNRIHRLATIEMPQQDIFNVNLNIETVTVWVDDAVGPEKAGVSQAILVYAQDIPDSLNQVQAVLPEDGSMLFENVIPGNYILRVQLENSVWLQQNVEIAAGLIEQRIQLDPPPEQTSLLYGQFLNIDTIGLYLTNPNQKIHIDITPETNGAYELAAIPSDIYSLAAFVNGRLIEFMQIDLQTESEMSLDIDPAQIVLAYSPLYVMVTDASGIVLSDAQIWLTETGGENLITASSTGRGVFLTAEAGSYTLSVAYPKYPTVNREITLKPSTLLAEPDSENTVLIQLGVQDKQ